MGFWRVPPEGRKRSEAKPSDIRLDYGTSEASDREAKPNTLFYYALIQTLIQLLIQTLIFYDGSMAIT